MIHAFGKQLLITGEPHKPCQAHNSCTVTFAKLSSQGSCLPLSCPSQQQGQQAPCQKEARPLSPLCVWQRLEGSFLRALCLVSQPANLLCSRSPLGSPCPSPMHQESSAVATVSSLPASLNLHCSTPPEGLEAPSGPCRFWVPMNKVRSGDFCEYLKVDGALHVALQESWQSPRAVSLHLCHPLHLDSPFRHPFIPLICT